MAEGYLRHFAEGKAWVFSAGIEAHGLNPGAVAAMKADGLDISQHTSNTLQEYEDQKMDWVITVCDNAKEHCPVFPGRAKVIHHAFPDPAGAVGTAAEIRKQFESVRDEIKKFCENFINKNL